MSSSVVKNCRDARSSSTAALPVPSQQCVAQRAGQGARGCRSRAGTRAAPGPARRARCGSGSCAAAATGRPGRRRPAPARRPTCRSWTGGTASGRPPSRRYAGSAPPRASGERGSPYTTPEQLLDLPRAEPQGLAVQLDQLAGDHQARRCSSAAGGGCRARSGRGAAAIAAGRPAPPRPGTPPARGRRPGRAARPGPAAPREPPRARRPCRDARGPSPSASAVDPGEPPDEVGPGTLTGPGGEPGDRPRTARGRPRRAASSCPSPEGR